MALPTNNANNAFPQTGGAETQRIYDNVAEPETQKTGAIEGQSSGVTAGIDGAKPQEQQKQQETQQNVDTTATETQINDATVAQPIQTQQEQQKSQTGQQIQPKTAPTKQPTKQDQQFIEMENQKLNYKKNGKSITKQIADEVAGELKALGERGGKLDDLTKNQVLAKVMQQYKDQIPQEELANAMKSINDGVLGLQTVGSWDEVYEKFNKSFKQANSLKNTDTNELAKGLASGLVTDSQMESLKNIDPAKYDEAYQLKNEITKAKQRNNVLNGKSDPELGVEKTDADSYFTREGKDKDQYANAVGTKSDMLSLYDSMVNTKGVNDMQAEVNELGTKINKLDREKSKLSETLTAEYETSLSKSVLSALIRDRQKPINEELINLRLEMDGKVSTLNSTKAENEKRFGIVMEEKKQKAEEEWKRTQREYKTTMDKYNMNRQMSMDEWNKYKDQTQMNWKKEDRDYMRLKPTQDQILASLEGENGSLLASKMSKLELEKGQPVYSYMDEDGTIKIYSKSGTGALEVLDTYIPLTPEQKEKKMTMVNYMKSRIGTPYQRGGQSDTGGVDCSGLILLSGMASGAIPEGTDMNAASMFNKPAKERDLGNLQEGDLVYFRGPDGKISHVASALGSVKNGKLRVIDASPTKGVSTRELKIGEDGSWKGKDGKYQIIGKENFMIDGGERIKKEQEISEQNANNMQYGPYYTQFFEGDSVPVTVLKDLGGTDKFAKDAMKYYIPAKNRELATYGYEISDPGMFIGGNVDKDKRAMVNDALNQKRQLEAEIGKVIKLLDEGGPSLHKYNDRGSALVQAQTNIQMILKGKSGFELGVIAGPDLGLLNNIIKPVVGREAIARGSEGLIEDYNNLLIQIDDKVSPGLDAMGLTKIDNGGVADQFIDGTPEPEVKISNYLD